MAEWVSKEGVMVPAKERVFLENDTGKDIVINGITIPVGGGIYEGPDRQAMLELKEAGVLYLGNDFRSNPDMFQLARQLGYKDVQEYADAIGYNSAESKKMAEKIVEEYRAHKKPETKPAMKIAGGGMNTASSGNDSIDNRYGGFGEAPKD